MRARKMRKQKCLTRKIQKPYKKLKHVTHFADRYKKDTRNERHITHS